jgi:hypothetical protein
MKEWKNAISIAANSFFGELSPLVSNKWSLQQEQANSRVMVKKVLFVVKFLSCISCFN